MKCWTTAIPSLSRLSVLLSGGFLATTLVAEDRRSIPAEHPRVLGSRAELQALAKQRPAEYHRMVAVARRSGADDHAAIVSQSLVAAIEHDADLGRQAKQRALKFVDGPNDGGQHHNWPHHNGDTADAAEWQKGRVLYDIADMLAFEDRGDYLYLAADATHTYSNNKLKCFTRQVVFLRPGTFVIFDRVTSTKPEFKKTWLLQAMKTPERHGEDWVVTNGQGRLFVQTVLPVSFRTSVAKAEELSRHDGQVFAPRHDTGPAPECRLEISPAQSNATDLFLHVLTATNASVDAVPRAAVEMQGNRLQVTVADVKLSFRTDSVGGDIRWRGSPAKLAESVQPSDLAPKSD